MTAERERMWRVYEKHVTSGLPPGTVYISNPITTSGHPVYLIQMSDYYARMIKEIDPKLKERLFVNELYDRANLPHPENFGLEWKLDSLDLGIFDKRTNVLFNIYKGHM